MNDSTDSRAGEHDGRERGGREMTGGNGGRDKEDRDENLSFTSQNNELSLLPRKRLQATKSPVEEVVEFGMAKAGASAEFEMIAVGSNYAAGFGDEALPPSMWPELGVTGTRRNTTPMKVAGGGDYYSFSNNDGVDGDGALSLHASFDAVAGDGGIGGGKSTSYGDDNNNPKKKEYTSPKRRKKQDMNANSHHPQHHQQSDSAASLQSSNSSASSFSSTLFTPSRPLTRMMTAAQQQQQQQLLQHQQQHQRRNVEDNDGSILFSPRPVATMMCTNSLLPPRPSSLGRTRGNAPMAASAAANAAMAMAAPSSPFYGKEGGNNSSSPLSSPSSSSALALSISQSFSPTNISTTMMTNMTPFRFHSFPASLPRVNPRGNGDVDGVTTTTVRPEHQQQLQGQQTHPPLPPSRLPPSPATRRLFMQSNDVDKFNKATSLMAGSKASTNFSGDWSEDVSVGSATNERIRMSKPEIPARHSYNDAVMTASTTSTQMNLGIEEGCCDDGDSSHGGDTESDTVVMQEDDDERGDKVGELNVNKNRGNAKDFGSSSSLGDDDDIVVDDDHYYKNDLLLPPPTTSSSSSGLLSGTRLSFRGEGGEGGEGGDVDKDGLRKGARSDVAFEDGEGGRSKTTMNFATSPKKKTTNNDLLIAPSHDSLETTLHPHTPRGILFTAASASGEQFHTMDNLEVSPIIRLPEDYDEHEMMVDNADDDDGKKKNDHATISRGVAPSANIAMPLFHHSASPILPNKNSDDFLSLHHNHPSNKEEDAVAETGILDASADFSSMMMPFDTAARTGNRNTNFASASQESSVNSINTSTATIPTVKKNTTTSTLNNSHSTPNNTTSVTSTTHRPTAQKKLRRPMPDTSAFDVSGGGSGVGGRSINTPSQQSLGSKDSGFRLHKAGGGGGKGGGSITSGGGSGDNSGRVLLCPPTPIRTPAWAHHAIVDSAARGHDQPLLKRANSLISTKVLAMTAFPPGVLDNLSSLEDSMLENDITSTTIDTSTAEGGGVGGQEMSMSHCNPNHNALLTLEEKDEYDGCIFRSLADGCEEDHTSPTLPLGNSRDEMTSVMPGRSSGPFSNTDSIYNDNAAASMSNRTLASSEIEEINFSDFDSLGILGSGAFADVYKVRSRKGDRRLYAIKRTRRQFRGVKDRERAMAEVHTMKRLQSVLLSEATAVAAASSSSSNTTASLTHQKGSGNTGNVSTMGQHHFKSNYGLYLLFFIRAWQQDGFFYCQTELCSRANCRHLRLSLSSEWGRDVVRYPSLQMCLLEKDADNVIVSSLLAEQDKDLSRWDDRLIPERDIWQICHDISRGLLHIHSYGMVHYDIKPSNIFFVYNSKWGTICKIGDFGLAGDIGTKDDGQEGDTAYMPNELLLSSCEKHPSADIFSLGIALYELAASSMWSLPREGDRWHEIRSEAHSPDLPSSRSENLVKLIRAMTLQDMMERPSAEEILELMEVKRASASSDSFLSRYVNDVERYDSRREREMESAEEEARRRCESMCIIFSFAYPLFASTLV
jgi:serine/threonine protein kinase